MRRNIPNSSNRNTKNEDQPTSRRLVSLDAFRGLTIIGMLLVNNIALDTFTPKHFAHAQWNKGVTFADMVFPWFLLIVGVAVPYAAASRKKKGLSVWQYDLKVLGRALMLVLLGCLIDSSIYKTPILGLGVLQLIGLAYMVGALLYEIPVLYRLAIAGGLLLIQWGVIHFIPVPGFGAGVFTEENNIIKHFNDLYFQPYHLSGLLSVVPTAAMVLIGTAIGDLLRLERISPMKKAGSLVGGGLILMLLGWLLSFDLPFNKPVWTASYILFAAGWGTLVLGMFYLIIDVKKWGIWAFPFVVFGMNAIAAYVTPILVKVYILQGWTLPMPNGSHISLQDTILRYWVSATGRFWGGWMYTFSYILFWWLVMLVLYRKKIFLRV